MVMSALLANLVWLLHMAFIAWMVMVPFSDNEPMLVLHLFTVPFLWFHWIMNDDTCSLTLIEMKLRGLETCEKSFFYSLVSPVYKPKDDDVRAVAWVAAIGLWLVTLSKVVKNPKMVGDVFRQAMQPFKTSSATEQ